MNLSNSEIEELSSLLKAAKLDIQGCYGGGEIIWNQIPTQEQVDLAKSTLENYLLLKSGGISLTTTANPDSWMPDFWPTKPETAQILEVCKKLLEATDKTLWGQLAPAAREENVRQGLRLLAQVMERCASHMYYPPE